MYEKINNISLGIGLCAVIGCLQNNRTVIRRAKCNFSVSRKMPLNPCKINVFCSF